jgi:hypothetical protein
MSLAGYPFRYPVKGWLRHASEICCGNDRGWDDHRIGGLPNSRWLQVELEKEGRQFGRRFRARRAATPFGERITCGQFGQFGHWSG